MLAAIWAAQKRLVRADSFDSVVFLAKCCDILFHQHKHSAPDDVHSRACKCKYLLNNKQCNPVSQFCQHVDQTDGHTNRFDNEIHFSHTLLWSHSKHTRLMYASLFVSLRRKYIINHSIRWMWNVCIYSISQNHRLVLMRYRWPGTVIMLMKWRIESMWIASFSDRYWCLRNETKFRSFLSHSIYTGSASWVSEKKTKKKHYKLEQIHIFI